MAVGGFGSLYVAATVDDAVAALADRKHDGAPLAGATWIMRAPIRGEPRNRAYVGIGRIGELRAVEIGDSEIRIGACVTHAQLAAALAGIRGCDGLIAAATDAANPAIREIATIGGNLCASDFAASDLAPALLALDAMITLKTPAKIETTPMDQFLSVRRSLAPGTLLTRIVIKPENLRSAHARLPLRKAGDYPVAIVSMAATFGPDDTLNSVRIAVGSVEAVTRRWPELEARLVGRRLTSDQVQELAAASLGAFQGRDGIEAPGWYRAQVLPRLARDAWEKLTAPQ